MGVGRGGALGWGGAQFQRPTPVSAPWCQQKKSFNECLRKKERGETWDERGLGGEKGERCGEAKRVGGERERDVERQWRELEEENDLLKSLSFGCHKIGNPQNEYFNKKTNIRIGRGGSFQSLSSKGYNLQWQNCGQRSNGSSTKTVISDKWTQIYTDGRTDRQSNL